jgi:RecA/RadA recombinase
MTAVAALRAQIKSALAQRVPKPLEYKPRVAAERVSTGIVEVDELIGGGLPRGCLTEVWGAASSGRSTLLVSLLAQVTQKGEAAALIDVNDAFAPDQAAEAGVSLEWLLWARCGGSNGTEPSKKWGSEARIEQTLKITDWLLQAGGFSVIALDMAGVPP